MTLVVAPCSSLQVIPDDKGLPRSESKGASLFRRLGVLNIDSYFHNRILRWAGHVARMPMSRAPRKLLTGWVSHSWPIGCPQMTSGRTLENALSSKGISKEFDEWIAIAKDRSKLRQLAHSFPKPSDDYNCITQKDSEPSQTCSEGHIFCCYIPHGCASVTAVYLPFFVFGKVLTRLD